MFLGWGYDLGACPASVISFAAAPQVIAGYAMKIGIRFAIQTILNKGVL